MSNTIIVSESKRYSMYYKTKTSNKKNRLHKAVHHPLIFFQCELLINILFYILYILTYYIHGHNIYTIYTPY